MATGFFKRSNAPARPNAKIVKSHLIITATDMPDEIRLDPKMFEVLSSETRRRILVILDAHPFTVSDLSRQTGIQKSALHKHLQVLTDAGLVYRKEPTNEFVYYDLTEKGKAISGHKPGPGYRIFLLLAVSVTTLLAGLFGVCLYLEGNFNTTLGVQEPVPKELMGLPVAWIELLGGVCLGLFGLMALYYALSSIKK